MTKNKDRKPDGYVEFFSTAYQSAYGNVLSTESSLIKALEFSRKINLKTVAIGRIYLNPKKQDHE